MSLSERRRNEPYSGVTALFNADLNTIDPGIRADWDVVSAREIRLARGADFDSVSKVLERLAAEML